MKPEQQRIAIVKALGWTCIRFSKLCGDFTGKSKFSRIMNHSNRDPIPDCNDLNVMHEAMRALTAHQQDQFAFELRKIVSRDRKPFQSLDFAYCNATAAQCREAFLKTIGKWEESK